MSDDHSIPGRPTHVRSLDTSWKNLLMELARAGAGFLIAFVISQVIAGYAGWSRSGFDLIATAGVSVFFGVVSLYLTSGRPIQSALAVQREDIARGEAQLRAVAARHQFAADLQNALEMAETESDAAAVVGRAISHVKDAPAELLLADSSRAHLHRVAATAAGAPGCSVPTPWSCPAVRRGQSLEFDSGDRLAACPRLQERSQDRAALCVPVTILGTPMGVLHVTSAPGELPSQTERSALESLAMQAGIRIGVLRAMASSELAATTDSLTGQLNRRTIETRLRDLVVAGSAYALAYVDLDHFKTLNDTHGHAAGDQALCHFTRVVGSVVREHDMVARYGGEEFIIVFPDCDASAAAAVVHRVQQSLHDSFHTSTIPAFTASYGLADSTYSTVAADVIAYADRALLAAKQGGRNRLNLADRSAHVAPAPVVDGTEPGPPTLGLVSF